MADPEFCDYTDINDLLGKKGVNPDEYYIAAGGSIEITAVTRLIQRRSKLLNEEHQINFSSTTYTEYYDINAIPRIELDHYPILSITSLGIYNGSEYVTKTEGLDRNSDDYYIEDAEAGMVEFWSTPATGKRIIKIVYVAGYSTIPSYVEECCAKMVAIDVALLQSFSQNCKEWWKRGKALVEEWLATIEYLLDTFIRIHPISIETMGRWHTESFVDQLNLMTGNYSD